MAAKWDEAILNFFFGCVCDRVLFFVVCVLRLMCIYVCVCVCLFICTRF